MTLLGLILGAVVGLVLGPFGSGIGAVLGGIVGAVIDIINFTKARGHRTQTTAQLQHLEATISELKRRVLDLEKTLQKVQTNPRESQPTSSTYTVNQPVETRVPSTPLETQSTLESPEDHQPSEDYLYNPIDQSVDKSKPLTEADQPVFYDGVEEAKVVDESELVTSPIISNTIHAVSTSDNSPPTNTDTFFNPPASSQKTDSRISSNTTPPSAPPANPLTKGLLELLTGGNTLVKVGVVVLTIGLGFLVQLAARTGYFPVEARLGLSAAIGIAMLVLGWRLTENRRVYALSLQGGGVGILYLTVFLSLQLYQLIPPTLAFILLVIIAASSAALAVLQNAQWLAVLGVAGGLLAPFFAAGNGGSPIALFSYYLVLNVGIFAIAYFKAWRPLLLLGFFGTFGLGTFWGGLRYEPTLFTSVEPFLIAFFLLYFAMSILFALRQTPKLRGLIDGTLVFALPATVFALQAALVRPFEFALSFSALGLAIIYMLTAWQLFKRAGRELYLLAEVFIALGLTFATLAIPLAFSTTLTSSLWTLEGLGLLWIGIRQKRAWLRIAGMLLQPLSLMALLSTTNLLSQTSIFVLGMVIVAAATLLSSYLLHRHKITLTLWEHRLSPAFLVLGLLAWLSASTAQFTAWFADPYHLLFLLIFFALTALACHLLAGRLEWQALHYPALALIIGMIWFTCQMAAVLLGADYPSFTTFSALTWLVIGALYAWLLQRSYQQTYLRFFSQWGYLMGVWLVAILGGLELTSLLRIFNIGTVWEYTAYALPTITLLFLLTSPKIRHLAWLKPVRERMLELGLIPLFCAALIWSFTVNLSSGSVDPLPYLPLLNPLDLTVVFGLLAMIYYLLQRQREAPLNLDWLQALTWLLIVVGIFWSSALVARTIHHYLGVAYTFEDLFASTVLQTSLSIFWSVTALVAMVIATRYKIRIPWLVGAGLLGLVVIKLFFVELANTTAAAKVISFVGVGVLLLLIGYVAPLPPKPVLSEKGEGLEP